MAGDLAVGDPHRDPHRTLAAGTGSHHFEDPGLLRVGDGERFALVAVAVLGHQAGHDLDGFPRGACPLQGDVHHRQTIDHSQGIVQLFSAAESGLGDDELVLIHQAQHLVGVGHLGILPRGRLSCGPRGLTAIDSPGLWSAAGTSDNDPYWPARSQRR